MMKRMIPVLIACLFMACCESESEKEAAALLELSENPAGSRTEQGSGDAKFMREAYDTLAAMRAWSDSYDNLDIQISLAGVSESLLDMDHTDATVAGALESLDRLKRASDDLSERGTVADEAIRSIKASAKGNAFRETVVKRLVDLQQQAILTHKLTDRKREAKKAGHMEGMQELISAANHEKEKLNDMHMDLDDYFFQWNIANASR